MKTLLNYNAVQLQSIAEMFYRMLSTNTTSCYLVYIIRVLHRNIIFVVILSKTIMSSRKLSIKLQRLIITSTGFLNKTMQLQL